LVSISYIPLGICLFRMLSKDIEKRRMENYKFSILISPVYSWFKKKQKRVVDAKTHKYFECPNCKTNLRVPKGKGNIVITCPKCKTELKKRT
jgi:Zn finger protein HypA/HybF involved in hydrogenase expression